MTRHNLPRSDSYQTAGSEMVHHFHVGADSVVRWDINNKVPPADYIEEIYNLDLISSREARHSHNARELEVSRALEGYRQAVREISDEERFEISANFQPGDVVVDIITGQRVEA